EGVGAARHLRLLEFRADLQGRPHGRGRKTTREKTTMTLAYQSNAGTVFKTPAPEATNGTAARTVRLEGLTKEMFVPVVLPGLDERAKRVVTLLIDQTPQGHPARSLLPGDELIVTNGVRRLALGFEGIDPAVGVYRLDPVGGPPSVRAD